MLINANGIDREATEAEIAEIEAINASAFDIMKELKAKENARAKVAEKLGLTLADLSALLA